MRVLPISLIAALIIICLFSPVNATITTYSTTIPNNWGLIYCPPGNFQVTAIVDKDHVISPQIISYTNTGFYKTATDQTLQVHIDNATTQVGSAIWTSHIGSAYSADYNWGSMEFTINSLDTSGLPAGNSTLAFNIQNMPINNCPTHYGAYASQTNKDQMPFRLGYDTNDWNWPLDGSITYEDGSYTAPLNSSFTCSPISQIPNGDIVCTDTSTGSPSGWYWAIDYETLDIKPYQEFTARNITWSSAYSGLYTVKLQAYTNISDSWNNKTNYVQISPLSSTSPYTLTLNATSINFGGSASATLTSGSDPSLAHLNGISYTYISPSSTPNTVPFYEVGSTDNIQNYYLYGATWKGYKNSVGDWTNTKSGIPNPATLKFNDVGTITVQCTINTDDGNNYLLTKTVTVGQGNFITTSFQAYDGSNYNFLQGVEIDVKNLNTNTWTNGTYLSGKVSITTPTNQVLSAYGTKAGYYPAKYENAPADGTPYSLVFYQIGAPPQTNYQIFYVNTFTSTGLRIPGALGTSNTTHATTGAAGSAQLNLFNSKLYSISATKTGYTGASTSYTTNNGTSDSITLIMNPIPTPTMTPITSWTVNQTGGNVTGFWAPWTNLFTQMGASSYEMPLLLAAFILLILMITGFAMAGILGGEIALGFGAILCVAIGLIPLWVVLAIIIVGFLFYGLKMVK
jgi:hypothetical protein